MKKNKLTNMEGDILNSSSADLLTSFLALCCTRLTALAGAQGYTQAKFVPVTKL